MQNPLAQRNEKLSAEFLAAGTNTINIEELLPELTHALETIVRVR